MRELHWQGADCTALYGRIFEPEGAADRLPLLCLPGLTRNGRDFDQLADALAGHPETPRAVITMDYRGRGRSGHADAASYTPQVEADDVRRGLLAAGIDRCAVLGTSRGGLIAALLAMLPPATSGLGIGPVILNDIGPVIEVAGLLRIRAGIDLLTGAGAPQTWPAAEALMLKLQGGAFPNVRGDELAAVTRQLFRDEGGHPVADFDPALLATLASLSPETPLPPLWPMFLALGQMRRTAGSAPEPRPLLVLRGALSDVLSEATLAEMQRLLPHLETQVVADQGHAPLLRDDATIARIADFLNGVD
ncbi:alpha/beta fold hydrolase [Methylobrevis albus]|uniref:Alpha/beta hydrolase n=1 Tax=Methylobrevis albus TaxID=2793297 RepID=A0A931HYK8_9HYPH|nr:alpha/beta hydrolase [Methylobrevis albus]MBH0237047.1 alpha/beta hydrolase [Methylobrevis albus]